jgi:SAM-dependent methyltransferase
VRRFDCSRWDDEATMFAELKTGLALPAYTGSGFHSLADALSDIDVPDASGVAVALDNFNDASWAGPLLDVLARASSYWLLFGRILISMSSLGCDNRWVSEDAAGFWDAQAAGFDDEPDHGLGDVAVRTAWERLLLAEMPGAAASVVDLGCGTGSLSVLLASAGHSVIGIDIAPRMIEAAREKAAGAAVVAHFRVGDAAAPGLAHRAFDAVLARHVLWAMPDIDAALAEWSALLRPGGRLVLIEGRWHTGAGLAASATAQAVRRHRDEAIVTSLDDPDLWGGPISDERYMVVSRR